MTKTFSFPALVALSAIHPAGAALVTYLSLDSAAGLTAGAPETGTNEATITAVGAKFGSAAQFDGAGDYFLVDAGGGVVGTGARTVSVWVWQVDGTSGLRSPVSFGANGTGTKFDVDIDNANDGIEVGVGAGRSTTSGVGFASDAWQHVAVTIGAGQTVGDTLAYLNAGSAIGSAANTRAMNTASNRMLVGTSANVGATLGNPSTQFFNGLVDDIAVWDEVLSQNELKGLFDVGEQLSYTAVDFDALKQVHDAGSGSVTVNGTPWAYAAGLGGGAGLSGDTLVLDAGAGTGLVIVPEPAAAALGALGLLALLRRRRG